MTKNELGKLYPIILESHNKNWKFLFEKEMENLKNLFGNDLTIEHIGSTAIYSIKAKPTIDILLEYPRKIKKEELIRIMENNNYIHMKEQKKHLMFVKGYTPTGLAEESYHIHVGPLSQNWLWDRIYFRDYLIKHDRIAKEYEKLKMNLAFKYKYDREEYTERKKEYINIITNKAKKATEINDA